jgi:hypothetical protein
MEISRCSNCYGDVYIWCAYQRGSEACQHCLYPNTLWDWSIDEEGECVLICQKCKAEGLYVEEIK